MSKAGAPDKGGPDLAAYYRFHSKIYDATRWSFLFGRGGLISRVANLPDPKPRRILEIGCGTGKNLVALRRRLPDAHLTGLDLSSQMLDVARRKVGGEADKVSLLCKAYEAALEPRSFDLIVASYTLTMINPGFEGVIAAAAEDLADGGRIAVVDFHASPVKLFEKWMGVNHVRMDGQLQPVLKQHFNPEYCRVRRAYAGLWKWITFVGTPKR